MEEKIANHLIEALFRTRQPNSLHPFAIFEDGGTLTYANFLDGAERVAATLRNSGVAPGDRVAFQAPKSITSLQMYLGAVMAGGIFVPLNPAYTSEEVEYFLADSQPKLLICEQFRVEALRKGNDGAVRIRSLEYLRREIAAAKRPLRFQYPVARSPSDIAAILYTSGTTGRPKGAMLSHSALATNSNVLVKLWRFSKSDVLIHALPAYHTHGLFVATNVALMAGCTLLFFEKFNADAVLSAFPKATALMGVPTFYTRMLQVPELNRSLASNMRFFISGSAPLLPETHKEWHRRTGHEILERYGMTEANMITSIPYDGPRKPGTVGLPLAGVELRIRESANGREVQEGKTGVLEIKSPALFSGYWQMPEKTKSEFTDDGYFITGDLASRDSDGFITIEGRAKDLVISGGLNIYPKEVEGVIDRCPGVAESAVFGVPHSDFGEAAVAVVVLEDADVSIGEIQDFLADKLARYKHPKRVAIMEALPRNAMGKVQKSVLRSDFKTIFNAA